MQAWRSILAYDGGPFHGWQVQPGLATVQGTLAAALLHLTGETVLPQGSGRTDAGVHALGQVASFALKAPIPEQNLERALNRALPPSIRLLQARHASPEFHARHSAVRKTYEYRLFCRKTADPEQRDRLCPPFLAPYTFDYPFIFDLSRANRAAAQVVGVHDFTSFAAADPDLSSRLQAEASPEGEPEEPTRGNVREIFSSAWSGDPQGPDFVYRVTGSGFLHHMVRNLVGTFLDVAAGRQEPEEIQKILQARNRTAAGPTAPARGLFLVEVIY